MSPLNRGNADNRVARGIRLEGNHLAFAGDYIFIRPGGDNDAAGQHAGGERFAPAGVQFYVELKITERNLAGRVIKINDDARDSFFSLVFEESAAPAAKEHCMHGQAQNQV